MEDGKEKRKGRRMRAKEEALKTERYMLWKTDERGERERDRRREVGERLPGVGTVKSSLRSKQNDIAMSFT